MTSYHHYLINSKSLEAEQKEAELNFLSFMKKIRKARAGDPGKMEINKLRKNISECSHLSRKDWLLDAVNELG
jgi:hypothetical protein